MQEIEHGALVPGRVFFKTYLSSLGWNAYDIVEAEPFVVHKLKFLPLDTPLEILIWGDFTLQILSDLIIFLIR